MSKSIRVEDDTHAALAALKGRTRRSTNSSRA
jgi:hypothetical protein